MNAAFRPDINAMRAMAVVAVVLFHFGVPGMAGGFAGVDVFFVISGFLIGGQIVQACDAGTFSFRRFYTARLRRIYPMLALVVLLCLVWGWFYSLPRDYVRAARHAAAAMFFVSNQAFAGERGYFDASALGKPLLHTWSLSVEGQFYGFLPLLLWALARWRRGWLSATCGLLLLASLLWCIWHGQADLGGGFYLLTARAWELLAGVLLASLALRAPAPVWANAAGGLALLLLLVAFVWPHPGTAWPGYWTLVPVAGAVLLIAAQRPPALRRVLEWRPLQWLGDVSYSLYLWHWPFLVCMQRLVLERQRPLQALEITLLLLASLVCAGASYRWIERPVRLGVHWWSGRRVAAFSAGTALGVFAIGLAIVASHGAPVRLPDYVQRATEAVHLNTPRDECFRNGASRKAASEDYCRFGARGVASPSVLLWGDSHANQYLTAVSEAATEAGLTGLIATQSGCSARLPGATGTTPERVACDAFNQQVWDLLVASPAITTVVIGKYWGTQDEGNRARMSALVGALLAHDKRVVLVGPLPAPGYDVPDVWSASQIKAGHAIDDVSVPRATQASVLAMNDALRETLAPWVAQHRVVYVEPFGHFCNATQCAVVQGGHSLYRDDSHISERTAQGFQPEFLAAFRWLNQTPERR